MKSPRDLRPPSTQPESSCLSTKDGERQSFVGYFETEQKMRHASAVFEQIDPSETPGTRASVDLCEVKVQRTMS